VATSQYAGRVSGLGYAPVAAEPARPALRLSADPLTLFLWLTATGLLIVIGWVKTVNLLLLLGYGLLTLMAVNGVSARAAVRRVRATRIPAVPGVAGRLTAVAVDVFNPTRRPAAVTVTDAAADARTAWLFAPLAAGTVHRLATTVTFPCRGRYPVGPLLAESGYPFGLLRVSLPLAPDADVLILPAPGRIDRAMLRKWLIRGGAADDGRTRRPIPRPTPGTGDLRGVRPFRPGDGLRDVHWRSSARRNTLLVREYDHPDPVELVVLLDPYLPESPTPADHDRLEWAVGLAMTLGVSWADGSEPVGVTLVLPGRPVDVRVGTTDPRSVAATFAGLADVAGRADVPTIPPLPGRGRPAVRLLCSTRLNSPVAAGWRAAGQPVVTVSAVTAPVWYTPPGPRAGK
jgi:uncharacterized protein (DUF58 family)